MKPFPKLADIYIGTDRTESVYILGGEFGPLLLTVHADCQDALDEYDERHGQRVEDDPDALADIGGIEAGIEAGEVRINSGGTTVFVSPYEWLREFPSMRAARAWMRQMLWGAE
jgi:hypothetical protein